MARKKTDNINHPSHYTDGKFEVIEVIEDWGLDKSFCLANAVKYIGRMGKKSGADPLEDLKKAQFYLNREIANRERAKK